MNSFSKIETGSDEEDDRLSNLPEFILCHILSLLPTNHAAKTSILSKRWKYLFLSVPKIDIYSPYSSLCRDLLHFISRRLKLCRTTSITAFRLRCWELPEASLVHFWLTALLSHNVEVLDIQQRLWESGYARKFSFSKHLVWESLVVLKLDGGQIAFKMSASVFFPNLKELKLRYVELKSQSETLRFSEECYPMIEDLRLEQVKFQENEGYKHLLHISSSTLKKLATSFSYDSTSLEKIDADAPHLQHLKLWIVGGAAVPHLQHVKTWIVGGAEPKMEINVCNLESIVSVYFFQSHPGGKRFTKLFSKVNNVRKLVLSGFTAEGLVDCVPLPPFPNLINLKIDESAKQSVWNVLQHSPNLETLELEGLFERFCPPPESVAPCFGRALGEICIRRFLGNEAEIEAVRYILQHGVVLQRLILHLSCAIKCKFSTSQKLLNLKRRSPDCEIELCV